MIKKCIFIRRKQNFSENLFPRRFSSLFCLLFFFVVDGSHIASHLNALLSGEDV